MGEPQDTDTTDLLVLGQSGRDARCRELTSGNEVVFRGIGIDDFVPGEILTVQGQGRSTVEGTTHLSGAVSERRIDPAAAGLEPLHLELLWDWDPAEHYWGEAGEPLEDWAVPMVERGPRPTHELEYILPGDDPTDWSDGPILRAMAKRDAGDVDGAREALMALSIADLRCLDAHAHLGNLAFDDRPALALRHYEVGVRIGEQALGPGFEDVLPWGCIDNRPFLRCLHGYGLCLWRVGRTGEALGVFERMLWLNPGDNQGVRFLLADVRQGRAWTE